MKIAIVIVNYKTPELVIGCLKSLEHEIGDSGDVNVFVGDADSQDGSVELISDFITTECLDWASCFEIGENGGFAFGNNYIVKTRVLPDEDFDFIHFLNPDTYIYPGAVKALADFLNENPNVAIAGSRLENPDGSYRAYGFRFPSPIREFFRGARINAVARKFPASEIVVGGMDVTQEVDWVSGASFMMRRSVLDETGLMDDGYFLYFEETDLMKRVRKAGHAIWHVTESRVVHIAGQATGMRPGAGKPQRVPSFWLRSRNKFFRDHYGWLGLGVANFMFLAGDVVYRTHRLLRSKPIENPPYLWRDYMLNSFTLPYGKH
ncbi:N-acetylglucosaminyl-diphospho-decaprenol L-rhamnosyltransferase [Roseovarius litorisediminis]|uniref:N-acetylglucosaminyl-diphospho-decaprenol L-rhamnosyltransferase n=1 Tax=Roseovarius litorisediminis TaxID=1312363 RepID=A0A1Y5TTW4_9RHOB|nr:glycosyltransferase family 2 protein [Roseovarius litorisediminis]SLN68177.1 N-acetylglucosaminyl-diphospho-decaprenol L-rhamnosyltransferase [Roseovarius litorisediminis]